MYAEALKPITDTMRKFPGVWDLPDAAGADKIKRLTIEVRTALNLTLPDEYIKFLKECDGLEFDGYIIYGTDHFLENQADYEDIAKQHIIFAEYDTGWFCMKKIGWFFLGIGQAIWTRNAAIFMCRRHDKVYLIFGS